MAKQGVPISEDVLRFKAEKWKERIIERKEELYKLIGRPVNLDSHEQVKGLLYGKNANPNFNGEYAIGADLIYDEQKGNITSSQYALAEIHYRYGRCQACKGEKDACEGCKREGRDYTDQVMQLVREIKLLRHRYSNFIQPFIDWQDCPKCVGDEEDDDGKKKSKKDKYSRGLCPHCGGTGLKEVTGHNPRYVSIKNDWWWFHPVYRQSPNTLRFACADRNIQQFARYLATFDIMVRDIIVAPPGYIFWDYDYSKSDRWGAAIIYNAKSILEELADKDAFARLGSKIFDMPFERCVKGQPPYTGAKTMVYTTQYGGKKKTVRKTVLQMCGIALSDEVLERGFKVLYDETYKDFYNNVKEHSWKSYQRGWAVSVHGALFRIPKHPILRRYDHWTEIKSKEAWRVFEGICRSVSAFVIQSTMTGLSSQLMLLKAVDELDRWMKAEWSEYRFLNGDWDKLFPFITKHDELGFCSTEELAQEGMARLEKVLLGFNEWEPYLPSRTDRFKFPLQVEGMMSRQFDVTPPANYQEMTKAKNPNHYYQDAVLYKK